MLIRAFSFIRVLFFKPLTRLSRAERFTKKNKRARHVLPFRLIPILIHLFWFCLLKWPDSFALNSSVNVEDKSILTKLSFWYSIVFDLSKFFKNYWYYSIFPFCIIFKRSIGCLSYWSAKLRNIISPFASMLNLFRRSRALSSGTLISWQISAIFILP